VPTTSPTAPEELGTRLEKVRFLVDEMALSADLARNAPNSDTARVLSRHVAVRTENSIEHVRPLRKRLNLATNASAELKETVNALASTFDEYFSVPRHKLGAHVQDVDFLDRLQLWDSIDRLKVDYFAESAREIWDLLGSFGVPGHRPFRSPDELSHPVVAEKLADFGMESEIPVTVATDWLASTRPNTLAMYNATPVHARAGQLSLLRRWIQGQAAALAVFAPHAAISRILKARLITDVVSFHDCLITRQLPPNAPQKMDGLDALLRANGSSSAAIDAFAAANRDSATIDPIRLTRNRSGAHLEIAPAVQLSTLTAELDGFDLELALGHYARLEASYLETCRETPYLRIYLADGERVEGRLAMLPKAAGPFDPSRPDRIASSPARPDFSEQEMHVHLAQWIGAPGRHAQSALDYFRNAFSAAPIVEERDRTERLGSGSRLQRLQIRTSHLFVREVLMTAEPPDAASIMTLLEACANGYPAELADILVEFAPGIHQEARPSLHHALGVLAPWWNEDARSLLEAELGAAKGILTLISRVALLRMFLRYEGSARLNDGHSAARWADLKAKVLSGTTTSGRLPTALALLSNFIARDTGVYLRKFHKEYAEIANEVLDAARARLGGTLDRAIEAQLVALLEEGGFARATLLLAQTGPTGHVADTKAALLEAIAHGLIVVGVGPDEQAALAECLLQFDLRDAALQVLERLSHSQPGNAEPQIRMLEILSNVRGTAQAARGRIAELRRHLQLDHAAEARLAQIESELPPVH
jgi:hypothetical protein